MRVVVTREARESLNAISHYIGQYSPLAARRVRRRLLTRIRKLADSPRTGRKVPEYDVDEVRELLEGDYRIWYRIGETALEVIAIFHGARDV